MILSVPRVESLFPSVLWKSCNQIPYLLGGQPTKWITIIPKEFFYCCEGSETGCQASQPREPPKELAVPRESDFECQWDLITGLPQD